MVDYCVLQFSLYFMYIIFVLVYTNLLVTFFFTGRVETTPKNLADGLLPCPFLVGMMKQLPPALLWVCVVPCPPAPVRTVGLLWVFCLFWRMTGCFRHWPSTLQSFLLLFQSFCCCFSHICHGFSHIIISACHFCSCLSCLPCLPVISVLSVISAMASAISTCLSILSFGIPSSLSFLPACLLLVCHFCLWHPPLPLVHCVFCLSAVF